jgi:hypothetical protein
MAEELEDAIHEAASRGKTAGAVNDLSLQSGGARDGLIAT